MSPLLIISIIWLCSEIILSWVLRANKTQINYDKSSLRILWTTIILSIFLGKFLMKYEFADINIYRSIFYYIGVILILVGLLIRWIAILKLKNAFTVNVNIEENQKMVYSGIYKFIRHPSYLGSLLSFLGLGVAFNNWFTLLIIIVPIFFAFQYRIKIEEEVLSKVFGDQYTDYVKKSWKLIPKVY